MCRLCAGFEDQAFVRIKIRLESVIAWVVKQKFPPRRRSRNSPARDELFRFLKFQEDAKRIFLVADHCGRHPYRLNKCRGCRSTGSDVRREIIAPPPHLITRRALLRNLAQRTYSNRHSGAALRALERDGFDVVDPTIILRSIVMRLPLSDVDFSLDAAKRRTLVRIAVGRFP